MVQLLPKLSIASFAVSLLYLCVFIVTAFSFSSRLPISLVMVSSMLFGLLAQFAFVSGMACLVILFTESGRNASASIQRQLITAGAIQVFSVLVIVFAYVWFLATSDFSH